MIEDVVAWVLLVAVAAYACAGGTDYGAGVSGWLRAAPNAASARDGSSTTPWNPVRETNNVWRASSSWSSCGPGSRSCSRRSSPPMWLPLALAAVGLVLRGAGFALRKPARRLTRRRVLTAPSSPSPRC